EGAESKYRVAEILYIRKEYEQAEAEIFDFIDKNPGNRKVIPAGGVFQGTGTF
ncbi:unnamed protein product, partial [marine sediment metagenome]